MRLRYSINWTVLACLAVFTLAACKDDTNPLLDTSAGKLAAIDAGTTNITEEHVRPYNTFLTKLEAKCDDTRTGISDTAVMAKNIFKSRKSRDITTLSIMRMIDSAIPEGTQLNCNEVIAAIIALS